MRDNFERQLEELDFELRQMGSLCEDGIAIAAKALKERDKELAKKVAPIASALDRKERDVEDLCLRLLLRQQPVAGDLRQISAALKMVTDMERIGDQAEDIADILQSLTGDVNCDAEQISEMARGTILMVTESVEAYVSQDKALAQQVIDYDDKIDALFLGLKTSLMDLIAKEPGKGAEALDILMIGKYFERIADHATNIAEWVIFSITGQHKSQELEKA